MHEVGRVEQIFRYPFKGMGGEQLEGLVGCEPGQGIDGDRRFYLVDPEKEANDVNPQVTARDGGCGQLVCYTAATNGSTMSVTTPDGAVYNVHDQELLAHLQQALGREKIAVKEDPSGHYDLREVSMISRGSLDLLSTSWLFASYGKSFSTDQLRQNLIVRLNGGPRHENMLIGRQVQLGETESGPVLEFVEGEYQKRPVPGVGRCKVITFDTRTGESDPAFHRHVHTAYGGIMGAYLRVVRAGAFREGDAIHLIDRAEALPVAPPR